jgi:hypothetical protein
MRTRKEPIQPPTLQQSIQQVLHYTSSSVKKNIIGPMSRKKENATAKRDP